MLDTPTTARQLTLINGKAFDSDSIPTEIIKVNMDSSILNHPYKVLFIFGGNLSTPEPILKYGYAYYKLYYH